MHSLEWSFIPPRRSVIKGYFEKHSLHSYHDDSLYEESRIISGAWPIEDFQYGSREHDEGYIEREAGRRACTFNREYLISVGCQRREY